VLVRISTPVQVQARAPSDAVEASGCEA